MNAMKKENTIEYVTSVTKIDNTRERETDGTSSNKVKRKEVTSNAGGTDVTDVYCHLIIAQRCHIYAHFQIGKSTML